MKFHRRLASSRTPFATLLITGQQQYSSAADARQIIEALGQ
jgi:hypothetical protein